MTFLCGILNQINKLRKLHDPVKFSDLWFNSYKDMKTIFDLSEIMYIKLFVKNKSLLLVVNALLRCYIFGVGEVGCDYHDSDEVVVFDGGVDDVNGEGGEW